MGLLQRIGDIWFRSAKDEALAMVDDFRRDYYYQVNDEDMLYVYDLILDERYEDAYYGMLEYEDVIHESDMKLFLRLLQEAAGI